MKLPEEEEKVGIQPQELQQEAGAEGGRAKQEGGVCGWGGQLVHLAELGG